MSKTDTTFRSPPPRRFENYVLTKVLDASAGLTAINDSAFTQVPGPGAATFTNAFTGAGAGGTDDALSNVIPIGFDFSFDGITYKQWVASTNGWMVLVDPTLGTFSPSEILVSSIVWRNTSILSTFTSQVVLLAPWFDDLRNVCNQPNQLATFPGYSATKINRIAVGLEPPPNLCDGTAYGVRYYNDLRSSHGRRLIVRWSSISNFLNPTSIIHFESVLYENGTIEFRYSPRLSIHLPVNSTLYEGATVGIFMPNGTNRFRDFAVNLGYRETARVEYVYGGFTFDPAYVDTAPSGSEDAGTSAPYTAALTTGRNWPGLDTVGCTFSFSPPQQRRRILPRLALRSLDAEVRGPYTGRVNSIATNRGSSAFDDRRSPTYGDASGRSLVNFPTTLPRFFGGASAGTTERQDLFAGDFIATASIVRSAVEQFINPSLPSGRNEAFNDGSHPEQGSTFSSSFFSTGSNLATIGTGFNSSLRSKTQLKFSLPVNTSISMPGTTSSVYYYNARSRSWNVPARSTYVLSNSAAVPPSPNPGAGGDWANAGAAVSNGHLPEDYRGMNALGISCASGSHVPSAPGDATDAVLGSAFSAAALVPSMGKSYAKSLALNPEYAPVPDESFAIPITTPLLLEKAIIELPMAAGPGWFADQTQCFIPLSSTNGVIDIAGPALTVALMRQVSLSGQANDGASIRDLILTGTITHANDNVRSIVLSQFPPHTQTYQLRPVGFPAYGGIPAAVVPTSGTFSGSVSVPCVAASPAAVNVAWVHNYTTPSASVNSAGAAALLTQAATIALKSSTNQTASIINVAPLGRGATGFQASGRSLFGGEHATLQALLDQTAQTIPNPFRINALSSQQAAALAATGSLNIIAATVATLSSNRPSPYLLLPGDRLIVSVAKARPFIYNGLPIGTGSIPTLSSSIPHDVTLSAGSINVTLYGCEVAAGAEHNDQLNQPLGSNAIHETIGFEPVLDQHELYYRNELSGSLGDDVLLGHLVSTTTVDGRLQVVTGVRDRKLSYLNARNAPALTLNAADVALNPSKSFRTQQWYERAGSLRVINLVDSTERFWDSMMPSIADCFTADNTGIFLAQSTTGGPLFGFPQQVDPTGARTGWIYMDQTIPQFTGSLLGGPTNNCNWNKAYPFEPRYSDVARQVDISKSFLATYNQVANTTTVIPPTAVDGFCFGTLTFQRYAVLNGGGGPTYQRGHVAQEWLADVNLISKNSNGYYVTSSAVVDDMSRALYGFGDRNTCALITGADGHGGTQTFLVGANHVFDYRDIEGPHPDGVVSNFGNDFFLYSPLIRGWKYGVHSGVPTFSGARWRRGRFGQLRDMLEQRMHAKFYQSSEKTTVPGFVLGKQPAVVNVRFVDPTTGLSVNPLVTRSTNLSFECTSSMPYFDNRAVDR